MDKKLIAWGDSKILNLYLQDTQENPFSYCIDSYSNNKDIEGLPIVNSDSLKNENKDSVLIVIFAVSNNALRNIASILSNMDYRYKENYIFYSDFLWESFSKKFYNSMGWFPDYNTYLYVLSFTLNSLKPIHTTILGSVVFLECIKKNLDMPGDIAEVGAFEGGNALCSLNHCYPKMKKHNKYYYIFDSFEGFPELSEHDPICRKKGDYCIETSFKEIENGFNIFSNVNVVKGFVPGSFQIIPEKTVFSVVFYDCDLYQPALDTFNYFWNKIESNGFLIIHDYRYEKGGFEGVRKATDEFFGSATPVISFYETTMGIIKK